MVYKLLCLDMDWVIFKDVNFWMELHKSFGTFEEGKILTEKYLNTNYSKLVEEVVVNLWKGKDSALYFDLVNSLEYLPGVVELFNFAKNQGFITAIISASSMDCARRVQKEFGVDHVFANELIIKNGKVSGDFVWPIGAGNTKKAEVISRLCKDLGISLHECIYIGDSNQDIEAFKIVGLSIAFNSSSNDLKRIANITVESNNLVDVLGHITV